MKRNLNRRVETVTPVEDPTLKEQLEEMQCVYEADNYSAWDMLSDGKYIRRRPANSEQPRPAQDVFTELARS